MSWEAATLLTTVAVGVLPLVVGRRRRRGRGHEPREQSWTFSVRAERRRE